MPLLPFRRSVRATLACLGLTGALAWTAPARADLHEEALRLADAWKAAGASVVVDRPRFLDESEPDHDHHVRVAVPELPEGFCTTVVILGSRGLGFHVTVAGKSDQDVRADRVPSVAGALSIEQCGELGLERIVVASDSGRGAFETIAARSSKPLPPLRSVLPERAGGTLLQPVEAGMAPVLPAPEKRAEVAEMRARRDGATIDARDTWSATGDRSGIGQETLTPGCHVLHLFAIDPRAMHPGLRGRLDLDAEMRDLADERLIARDRSDAPDAMLTKCVGETTGVAVAFAGAMPGSPVLVSHAEWPLPEHLPGLWGPIARARMAHVLLARHLPALRQDPSLLAQGGNGTTPVPLSLEPGGCYLAIATLIKEQARSLGLRIRVGSTDAGDDRGIDDDGAAVAFCAGGGARATALVEARGTPLLGWGLALYRLQSSMWRASR